MRSWLASGLVLAVVASSAACGGKVAVDVGGAGGGTSSSSSGTTSSGCSAVLCQPSSGSSCVCAGECDLQSLKVQCVDGSCSCWENQIDIFHCNATGSSPCDLLAGCCAAAFFGGGTGQ